MDKIQKKKVISLLVKYFHTQPEILLAYLFGSSVKGRGWKRKPDIDLALLCRKKANISRIYADIISLLKSERVDIVFLNTAPLSLIHEIIKTGECIFTRIDRAEYERRQNLIYYDTKYLRDLFTQALFKRLKEKKFARC